MNRRLSDQTVAVLRVLLEKPLVPQYGRDIGKAANLKSGSLHPILGRLEQMGWVESFWEATEDHANSGRPRRRYYQFAAGGAEAARLAIAEQHQGRSASTGALRPQVGH
jgi:DNA-binding PadR family transcriptional regulator